MTRPIDIGHALWAGLAEAFTDVALLNGFTSHAQQAQMWAGFISAASGAMARDLGRADAVVVLQAVINAAETLPEFLPPAHGRH